MSSGGDPADEGGQAIRTGFIQAMQSSAMMMNLLQRRGAESRSIAEYQQRQTDRATEQGRKDQIHGLQTRGYRDRAEKAQQLHDLEIAIKQARLTYDERADGRREAEHTATERRRDKIHGYQVQGYRAERNRKDAIHSQQVDGYTTRKAHAAHLHALDVEYKKLLIDGRRRAMGFTETLVDTPSPESATAAAAWAAARNTADLSDDHQQYCDAYTERYSEDTGENPADLIEAAPEDYQWVDDSEAGTDSDGSATTLQAMAGVAEELTFSTYAEHLHTEDLFDAGDNESAARDGAELHTAVEAAGLDGAVADTFDTSPAPEAQIPGTDLDTEIEP
ncbi:hypothetical protein NDR87_14185 [Nocardia sp. CDC159]|uniref:Uncharacterized protein n=1 Tax=Nocardia pulmonis TaxID=2951408 RepID=A0A9X2IW00_9NOCA|nr:MULTISPECIES: hypothetical protein [Nocardia]MCM6774427.1 hypothetical protein [Nocardia pulmonis]MCM6787507.1 hypothetical protein [Nocardia sp. CDC159]